MTGPGSRLAGPAVRDAALLMLLAVALITGTACSGDGGPDPSAAKVQEQSESHSDAGRNSASEDVVLLDDEPTGFLRAIAPAWRTDFSIHSVPLGEIRPGGPPRDGIPPIDRPQFAEAGQAPEYLVDEEPVLVLELGGERRAYPLSILILHEIVNDRVGGVPVAVTYCPLCNTGLAFERTVDGQVMRFGTTGLLRNSNLIMWDDATDSWWQQATGEAIVGELTGSILRFIPVQIASWEAFRDAHDDGLVLTRDTGFVRSYDLPPYGGYDAAAGRISEFSDGSLAPIERVVSVTLGGESVAYPFSTLEEIPIIHDTVAGTDIVVFYVGGTLSPFPRRPIFDFDLIGSVASGDGEIPVSSEAADRRDVGATGVFEPRAGDMSLTFVDRGGVITDNETGSSWNIFGEAEAGELAGTRLRPVLHGNHFWFSLRSFFPDTAIRTRSDVSGPTR